MWCVQYTHNHPLSTVCTTGYNSTKEKEKLQNVMTYGSETAPTSMVVRPQAVPEDETEVDRFDEVLKEIDERREFLEEMEALGQGKNYRAKVMTEISQVSDKLCNSYLCT